jgi:hypothetical protein
MTSSPIVDSSYRECAVHEERDLEGSVHHIPKNEIALTVASSMSQSSMPKPLIIRIRT